jgi:hypothetical protein
MVGPGREKSLQILFGPLCRPTFSAEVDSQSLHLRQGEILAIVTMAKPHRRHRRSQPGD